MKFNYDQLLSEVKSEGFTGGYDLDMPEIPVGVRNDVMFRIACRAWSQGTPQDVLQGFLFWTNEQRCKPPMDKGEVLQIIAQAVKYEQKPDYEPANTDSRTWIRASEVKAIAASEPPLTNVCGPFRTGAVGFISAAPGVGKSMFALAMAGAISQGKRFGLWDSLKSPVRYVDAELTHAELDQRLDTMGLSQCHELYIDTESLRMHREIDPFSLGHPDHQKALRDACGESQVIIVDNVTFTLEAAPGKSLYDPETINQIKPLISWARLKGKCLILVDHTNKEGGLHGHSNKLRMAQFDLRLQKADDEPGVLSFTGQWNKYRIGDTPPDFAMRLCAGWQMTEQKNNYQLIKAYLAKNPGVETAVLIDLFDLSKPQINKIRRAIQGDRG
jgi:hypothetical protein